MFYKYLLINDEGNKVLYLYVDNNFEFGSMDYKKDKDNIYLKVKKYMERMGISFSGNKVCFVKNGIIIGMIDISDYDFSYNRLVEIIDANSSDKLIDMEKSNGLIEKLKLNEYIFGVVSGEMPAIFKEESLKAQAVIARTYALKRLKNNLPIKNFMIIIVVKY